MLSVPLQTKEKAMPWHIGLKRDDIITIGGVRVRIVKSTSIVILDRNADIVLPKDQPKKTPEEEAVV